MNLWDILIVLAIAAAVAAGVHARRKSKNNRRTIKALQTGCGAFVYVRLYGKIILCYHKNKRKKCGS